MGGQVRIKADRLRELTCQRLSVSGCATVSEMCLERRIVADERGLKVPCSTPELLARLGESLPNAPGLWLWRNSLFTAPPALRKKGAGRTFYCAATNSS